jgi:peptide/nickel transport system substrate-binding protein
MRQIAPAVVGAAALALIAAGCGGGTGDTSDNTTPNAASSTGSGSGSATGTQALTIGMPNGPVSNNSNPFLGTSAGAALGYTHAIYEPLMQYNDTDPAAKPVPWLATSIVWNKDYTSAKITARQGVKFSDGTPMTAADIAYSLQIRKDNAALNAEGFPYKSITTSGNVVTVTFKTGQFVNQQKLDLIFVVPKHIWSKVKDPTKDLNQHPVGTGPYVFKSFSGQTVSLDKNTDYWGGSLAVPKLQYTAYNGNPPQITALQTGASQWSWVFIPDYKNTYVAKDPAHNQVYYPAGLGIDNLVLNTAKGPFKNVALRQAANMVLDREKASKIAESGLFPELTSVTAIATPAGSSFLAPQYKNKNYTVDVTGAKKTLTDAGYTYSGSKLMDPSGKAVAVTLQDPSGWSDYDTDLKLIATSFKSIGIDATVETPTVDAWTQNMNVGNFDASIHWTDGGATPYQTYSSMFDPNYYQPLGKTATWDLGRYNNPEMKTYFDSYTSATTDAARQTALNKIQALYMKDMPALGVNQRPSAAEFSTKYYTGWPTADNSYADPQPTNSNISLVLKNLKPAN